MTDNKHSKLLRLFCKISLALGVLYAVLYTLCIHLFYDESVFLYEADAILPTVMNITLAVYAVLALIVALAAKNHDLPNMSPIYDTPEKAFCMVIAVLLVLGGIMDVKNAIDIKKTMLVLDRSEVCAAIAGVLSIIASLYFFLHGFAKGGKKASAGFGLIGVAFAVLKLLSSYFSKQTHINDPIKVFSQFALIALMVYLLIEIRFDLGVGKGHFFVGFGSLSFVFLFMSSVCEIAYGFTTGEFFEYDGLFALAKIVLALLLAVRMTKFIKAE